MTLGATIRAWRKAIIYTPASSEDASKLELALVAGIH